MSGHVAQPVPAVAPAGMGKATRDIEISSLNEVVDTQLAVWITQIKAVPGLGGKKR